jgi:hypothetical protein
MLLKGSFVNRKARRCRRAVNDDRPRSPTPSGALICLEEPTKGMVEAARSAGKWDYNGRRYHRLQIRTIGDLLAKRGFEPPAPVQPLNWEPGRLPL